MTQKRWKIPYPGCHLRTNVALDVCRQYYSFSPIVLVSEECELKTG